MLPSEDQPLLVGRDTLLILNLRLDIVDGVGGFDFEGDGFAGEGFDEAFSEDGSVHGRALLVFGDEEEGRGGEGTSALWLRVEVSNGVVGMGRGCGEWAYWLRSLGSAGCRCVVMDADDWEDLDCSWGKVCPAEAWREI